MALGGRMRLSRVCCVFYQLCVLSSGLGAGLHALEETEEWEIVFPALWSPGQQEPMGGSGAGGGCSADPSSGNQNGTFSASVTPSPVAGSSREVRSVSSSVDGQAQAVGEATEEEDTEVEYESQEFYHWSPLPQGSGAASQLPPSPSPPPLPPSEDGDEVLLRIPAFARELYLLLKRDSRFLAPGFAVEERLGGEGKSLPSAAQSQPERACYYSGAVLRYPGSFASFSTCGGLNQPNYKGGLIRKCLKKGSSWAQGMWTDLGRILGRLTPPITWDFTLEQVLNPNRLTRHLRNGCLAYPGQKQQVLALYWSLACSYRATIQYSQKVMGEAETQTEEEARAQTSEEAGTQSEKEAQTQVIETQVMEELGTQIEMEVETKTVEVSGTKTEMKDTKDTLIEMGTQAIKPGVVIAPVVKNNSWTRRSTGAGRLDTEGATAGDGEVLGLSPLTDDADAGTSAGEARQSLGRWKHP
ncbi:hypothetical protein WISP_30575 [Willisornis vidua]|uniref:Peptidase M12B propeptide domain-containing protein n=1 Tax=Willisornis vidua TaxID=1566151 RepID=A0ABQ9DRH4_9PASS|nr:hypothetical protein WISP_30575 [Willisornis vidua]